ncbi:unnamed protein product, partial [Ectocarpus sp. 12 AP-2014]
MFSSMIRRLGFKPIPQTIKAWVCVVGMSHNHPMLLCQGWSDNTDQVLNLSGVTTNSPFSIISGTRSEKVQSRGTRPLNPSNGHNNNRREGGRKTNSRVKILGASTCTGRAETGD